jgi:hypothetical protein
MLTSSHVRAARDTVVDPVVAAGWDFEPGGSRPKDKEAARYCRWVFLQRLPWKQYLGNAMRAYLRDGFAIVEKREGMVPLPPGRFPLHNLKTHGAVITRLHVRPGWSITDWYQHPDDGTMLVGVRQWLQGSDQEKPGHVDISSSRFIRYSWEQEGANYEGLAPQRSAYGPWFIMRLLTRIEAQGHERNHMAMPVARRVEQSGGSEDDDKKLEKALANWRAHEKGNAILPFGYELQWSEHGQQTNIAATIATCKFDIAHNYLTGFMLIAGNGVNNAGSHALAGTQKGQYELGLTKHADFACTVHNFGLDGWSIVERIVRLNYGDDVAIPTLVYRYLPTVDFLKVLPILAMMRDKKIVRPGRKEFDARLEQYALQGLKAPEPDPEEPFETEDPTAASDNEPIEASDADPDDEEQEP